jgi:hypothetical protein
MPRPTPLTAWMRRSSEFLIDVWKHHQNSRDYVVIAARRRSRWHEIPLKLDSLISLPRRFKQYPREDWDLYFCPNAFRQPTRRSQFASPTPFSWCDLDDGDASNFSPQANIIWETSPGRLQALFIWDKYLKPQVSETYSRALTDMAEGDSNGWSVTKLLRIPHTINHKPEYDEPIVRLTKVCWRPQSKRLGHPFHNRSLNRD